MQHPGEPAIKTTTTAITTAMNLDMLPAAPTHPHHPFFRSRGTSSTASSAGNHKNRTADAGGQGMSTSKEVAGAGVGRDRVRVRVRGTGNAVSRNYRPRSRSPPSSPDPAPISRSTTPSHHHHHHHHHHHQPGGTRDKRRSFSSRAPPGQSQTQSQANDRDRDRDRDHGRETSSLSTRPVLKRGETGMSTQADLSAAGYDTSPGRWNVWGRGMESESSTSDEDEHQQRQLQQQGDEYDDGDDDDDEDGGQEEDLQVGGTLLEERLATRLGKRTSGVFPRLTPPITHQTDFSQSTSNDLLPPNSTPSTPNTAAAIPIPPSSFPSTTRPRSTALLPHRFAARLHLRQWETTWGCKLTRRRCERGLLIGSAGWLVDRLARELGEVQVALELGIIIVLTMAYLQFRTVPGPPPDPRRRGSGEPVVGNTTVLGNKTSAASRSSPSMTHPLPLGVREKRNSMSMATTSAGTPVGNMDGDPTDREDYRPGSIGTVWATEPKDYRDCLDDGAAWALLLGPILSGSMFYETCTRLSRMYAEDNRTTTTRPEWTSNGWRVEPPLVSPSTRPFVVAGNGPGSDGQASDPAVLALSALAYSRKQACHLMCLLSLLLLAHTLWSRKRHLALAMSTGSQLNGHHMEDPTATTSTTPPSPWSKRSEWRRTGAVVAFSFILTAGFVVLKVIAQLAGVVGSYDFTYSDLVISTLFFQFSLYVCVRLARRGFTLGELGIICHAGTGLFMEVVNLTRTKISIFNTPFVRTYRLPTPLLIFQLALIPGSFLCGFLLSPLLVLSRRIAQRPVYRLRYPEEKQLYRKGLAAGFYAGAILICGGLIGFWARWCLAGRNPLVWVVMWLMEGRRWWSRPALIGYWAMLAGISVGGWTRQLSRARRHRGWTEAKVTNGQHKVTVVSKSSATKSAGSRSASVDASGRRPTLNRTPSPTTDIKTAGLGGVASHMMDEMDQRLPVFSINARRKFFHALAVVMFVPGIIFDPAFTHLSFSLAFAMFNFAEYVRYFALYPFGAAVHLFLNEFLDKKDSGTAILSHFYLLTGCAGGIWLDSPRTILSLVGVFSLGIGDALASIVGKRIGRIRWSTSSGKTVEGSVAFLVSLVLAGTSLSLTGVIESFSVTRYIILSLALSLMEAVSEQNDNLILPIWGWCLGVSMGL